MTEQEAIEALKEHKKQIDKEYINTRNAKAIEKILDMIKKRDKQIEQYLNILMTNDLLHVKESQEKDKIIDLMAEYLEGKQFFVDKYFNVLPAKIIKQHFEKIAKGE